MRLEADALSFARAAQGYARADALIADGRIELDAVREADSAGIALLLELKRRAQRAGRPLEFVGAPPQLRSLLGFFGVAPLLGIDVPQTHKHTGDGTT
ncbi:STAS domain-containing protein [Sinimarinibacterium thermocellulolyticum]|uniref:STAS domain-containing protein n=1 Tax=Sinimarinibacterium thermocellulolyticum TaxID=3170016 RepID=A0ABV2A6X1_9GAMM